MIDYLTIFRVSVMFQTSNYYFPSRDEQIHSMIEIRGVSGVKAAVAAIDVGLEKIKQIKEIAKAELRDKTEAVDFKYWRQVLTDEIEVCKRVIKWLKQRENSDHPKLVKTLEKIKALKIELQMLEDGAGQQEQLMQNREDLYQSRELPSLPSFDRRMHEIVSKEPRFEKECQHFQDVLKRHTHVLIRPINYSDLHQLKVFYQKIEGNAVAAELAPLVKHEIDLLEKTFAQKQALLKDVVLALPNLNKGKPLNEWSFEEKLTFYVKTQQILHNPFEPPIDFLDFQLHSNLEDREDSAAIAFHQLCRIIEAEKQQLVSAKKEDFWDFADIFEKKAHQLATTKEKKAKLYAIKMEGLREILAKVKMSSTQEVLVIGGGPGGLMRALALGFSGHPYRVLEKRANEAPKRSNVITLASGTPSGEDRSRDLNILLFLGFISAVDKDEKGSFGHLKPNLLEIPLGDVERYLMQILTDIGHADKVSFQTEPCSITNKGGQAEVTIRHKNGAEEIIHPSMIIATDGASSPTRTMLGISRNILAKTTQIAYSILKVEPSQSLFKNLKYRIHYGLKAALLSIAVAIYALVLKLPIETAYNYIVKGGPTAIFRIPEHDYVPGIDLPLEKKDGEKGQKVPAHDYLIRVLREKEQAFIDSYKDKVEVLAFRIRKINEKLAGTLPEKESKKLEIRLATLKKEHEQAKQRLESVLTSQAQEMHSVVDVLSSWISKNHRIQPMKVEKNFLVDIFMGTAEQSMVQVGSTPVILRGDASHTTDPMTGYGCKIAIEETLADQWMFSFGELNKMHELALSCHQWTHEFYREIIINQGFKERNHYRPGTEFLSRYVGRAVKDHLLTKKEASLFHAIANKMEFAQKHGPESFVRFSSLEKDFMKEKMEFLTNKLKEQWENRHQTVKGMDASWIDGLTSRETKILEKVIKQLIQSPQSIDAKTMKKMRPILGKLAYENSEFASTMGLLMHCY